MADSESESNFLGFATSDFQTDSDAETDLDSDVSVSDVSSNDLGHLTNFLSHLIVI